MHIHKLLAPLNAEAPLSPPFFLSLPLSLPSLSLSFYLPLSPFSLSPKTFSYSWSNYPSIHYNLMSFSVIPSSFLLADGKVDNQTLDRKGRTEKPTQKNLKLELECAKKKKRYINLVMIIITKSYKKK
jgi:hypothetical protein